MGTPVPNRAVEEACRGAGPLTVTTIDRLDPATREELIRKYGLQIAEPSGGESDKVKESSNEKQAGSDTLTKEKYLELSGHLPDYKIANQFNISTQALKRRKEGWGIPDRRRNPAKPRNSENAQAKGIPDRPTSLPTIENKKVATDEKDEQTSVNGQWDVILAKVALLEQQLQEKDEEIADLKAKNEQLRDLYEQQIKEIQEASFHTLFFRTQDLMHLTIKTDKEDVADNTKRSLQKLGVDFDYKVRKGVIEVTTAV